MIHLEIEWSRDPAAAPRGRMVERRKPAARNEDGDRVVTEFVPDVVLALSACGRVLRTYWIPPRLTASGKLLDGGRWSGFNVGEEPMLWARWPNGSDLIELVREKADG